MLDLLPETAATVTTSRVQLRVVASAAELAVVASWPTDPQFDPSEGDPGRVPMPWLLRHPPDERPESVARHVLGQFDKPGLPLQVLVEPGELDGVTLPDGRDAVHVAEQLGGRLPVGFQSVHGRKFDLTKTVHTGSWLAAPLRGRGLGTHARAAALELARQCGAEIARTSARPHNTASRRVTEKIGYQPAGTAREVHDDRSWNLIAYELDLRQWKCPVEVDIKGLDVLCGQLSD